MKTTTFFPNRQIAIILTAGLSFLGSQKSQAVNVTLTPGSNAGPWTLDTATNTFTVPNNAIPTTIDGIISGTGGLDLVSADANNAVRFLDVNVASTYSGFTRLRSFDARFGVRLGIQNAFPTDSSLQFNTNNAGSGRPVWLDLNGFSQQFASIGDVTTTTYNAIVNGNTGTEGSLVVNNSTTVSYNSRLGASVGHNNITSAATGIPDGTGDNFSLTKSGSGTLNILQNFSYTGDTTVEAGILVINHASLADTSTVLLSSGGVLNLNFDGNDAVDSLSIDGVVQPAGVWGAVGSGAERESALITGTGLLTVSTGEENLATLEILSFTAIGNNVWEIILKGQASTGYQLISSESLNFESGTLLEGLVNGVADPGDVSGANNSVITTDATGTALVQTTLSGALSDFVRLEAAP